ncbi:MAG: hypothetical protein IPP71_02390 [Bacteroidetes bacterium]|nr:hypothetical protein [Bacteroidota bacterium]
MIMLQKQLALTNEQTSPLFRIMWAYNVNEPTRRNFDNNICAFHIGKGLVLSVAHNIRAEAPVVKSLDEAIYATHIAPHLSADQIILFSRCYVHDPVTNKRYLHIANQGDFQNVTNALRQINFDTRWITLTERNICKPHLIIQFKDPLFYNDKKLDAHFTDKTYFAEPSLSRHTYIVELELVEAFYSEDIALYRIVHTHTDIINRIPSLEIDFSLLGDDQQNYYCLQSSPGGFLGRLINKAQIEGYLDHHGTFGDRFGGNYTIEGLRYLIKGYFRFGSSGAPYIYYDSQSGKFKANAVQSEACPLQLSINNNREGNFQFVNALASPLSIVENRLRKYLAAIPS